jgi:hypothetical protein
MIHLITILQLKAFIFDIPLIHFSFFLFRLHAVCKYMDSEGIFGA